MKFISLFSGAGGFDLGFEQEGFKSVAAYDNSGAAVRTYNYNRGAEIALVADLSKLTANRIIQRVSSLDSGETPCGVVGGPPCQYFSNGNRTSRERSDPRRELPATYAKILRRLNDEYSLDFFIFENVDGLAKPAHREDFDHVCALFDDAGFYVSSAILDAHDFGVAQNRKRLFIVGWNKGSYPRGAYRFPEGNPSGLTVRNTIEGLAEPRYFERNLDPSTFPEHPNHWTMQPISGKFRDPPPPDLSRYTRSFRRLFWDEVSYTVAYGHNEIHVHPEGHRRLSIYEAMLLQGFPPGRGNYRLLGNLSEQVVLVSNAVPPPLAAALARSIRRLMTTRGNNGKHK